MQTHMRTHRQSHRCMEKAPLVFFQSWLQHQNFWGLPLRVGVGLKGLDTLIVSVSEHLQNLTSHQIYQFSFTLSIVIYLVLMDSMGGKLHSSF